MPLYLLVAIVALLLAFYGGVVLGVADCKRSYCIPRHVMPGEYNAMMESLKNDASAYHEVVLNGNDYP